MLTFILTEDIVQSLPRLVEEILGHQAFMCVRTLILVTKLGEIPKDCVSFTRTVSCIKESS